MLISVKLLAKYVIIIYTLVFTVWDLKSLASESKPFLSWAIMEIHG